MKRSEMIKKIAEHVHDAIEIYAASRGCKDQLFAEKILNFVEKRGMNPPKVITQKQIKTINNTDDCELIESYEWESENE